jgi:hypothetical protein
LIEGLIKNSKLLDKLKNVQAEQFQKALLFGVTGELDADDSKFLSLWIVG